MKRNHPSGLRKAIRSVVLMIVAGLCASAALCASAQAPSPTKPAGAKAAKAVAFASPQAGIDALIDALRAADSRKLAAILGPGHKGIIDSGDSVADRAEWARFVAAYDTRHSLQMDGDAKATLIAGKDDFPMPIPLVRKDGAWSFDSIAGEDEILARRIGRNELDAIEVCLAFIDMQREYAEADRDSDGILQYAQRFLSTPGKHDGLYWPTKAGEPQSPGGPRLAAASAQRKGVKGRTPYHGYYYRILTAQGRNAPGGATSYLANGKLIGGVALLAYPAKYLNSGVKSFVCNTDGIVYEKDLGPGTATLASKIDAYDPDASWTRSK